MLMVKDVQDGESDVSDIRGELIVNFPITVGVSNVVLRVDADVVYYDDIEEEELDFI
jgi:hypothetical protein